MENGVKTNIWNILPLLISTKIKCVLNKRESNIHIYSDQIIFIIKWLTLLVHEMAFNVDHIIKNWKKSTFIQIK
jgi:hypothetical protein